MIPRWISAGPTGSGSNDAIRRKERRRGRPALRAGFFVLISLMDRVRTNATLFAEHSASIKRSYGRAGHTRRFALRRVTRPTFSSPDVLASFFFLAVPNRSGTVSLVPRVAATPCFAFSVTSFALYSSVRLHYLRSAVDVAYSMLRFIA